MRSSDAKNSVSGSGPASSPEMCGVIVGSTWSPDSRTPAAGSSRHRWSGVWPGVWTATHSRRPRLMTSASRRRVLGAGVASQRLASGFITV